MNPGDLLLHLNPLLLLASLAAGALHLRDGDAEKRLLQRVSLGLLLGSLTARPSASSAASISRARASGMRTPRARASSASSSISPSGSAASSRVRMSPCGGACGAAVSSARSAGAASSFLTRAMAPASSGCESHRSQMRTFVSTMR